MGEENARMKKRFLYICTILFVLNLSILVFNSDTVKADSINKVNDEIKKIEKEQQDIKSEQNKIHSEKAKNEEEKDGNLSEQEKTTKEIEEIDQKLTNTQNQLQTKETEIETITNEIKTMETEIIELESEIDILSTEITELQKRIKKRDVLLRDRLVSLQQNGGQIKYIEVILGSQSFADFISRSLAVTTIMSQDKAIIEEHKEDRENLRDKKEQVEENKSELEETKEQVEKQKVTLEQQKEELMSLREQLDQQMEEKDNLMAQLQEEFVELEEYSLTLEEEQEMITAQVSALERAKKNAQKKKDEIEQLAKAEKANQNVKSNGDYIFIQPAPLRPGGNYSHFGMRIHPISNTPKLHGGIDIPNVKGTPIIAAASGEVATVTNGCSEGDRTCGGGFGNYITIAHYINGQSYVTLYAHLNGVNVVPGQVVQQGDKIGDVGNTGSSTGPHLHFEVHQIVVKEDGEVKPIKVDPTLYTNIKN